jgi:hypothetical protein
MTLLRFRMCAGLFIELSGEFNRIDPRKPYLKESVARVPAGPDIAP